MGDFAISDIETLIKLAIDEDIRTGDVTGDAVFKKDEVSEAYIVSKDDGIFCGGFIPGYVYGYLDKSIKCRTFFEDGSQIKKGDVVMEFNGPTIQLLSGERIVLNFMQRMCGIATETDRVVSQLKGSSIKILDTRKTLPGFRLLDKYSVKTGGGTNHRMGLFDMVMIKDNHIKSAGSIAKAVALVRKRWNNFYKIEVETTTLDEVREAVQSGADIIMLDNMNREMMQEALKIIMKKAEVEISGNMSAEKITQLKDLDVDYISIGALTHSVKAFDLSMKFR